VLLLVGEVIMVYNGISVSNLDGDGLVDEGRAKIDT
jgi:hypothetical protein